MNNPSIEKALDNLPRSDTNTVLANAVSLLFFIIGVAAVIMIIFSGIQLVTSAGNASAVARAKNTIIYSVIGLVVSILAYTIVNFVVGNL